MSLTYRAVALALLGLVPVAVWPHGDTVRWWWVAMLVVIGLDVLLAASPRVLTLTREGPAQVRLGEDTATSVLVTNGGGRRVRGAIRDAWPPSAGADPARHALDLAAGERARTTTAMHPTRRGDRAAHRVTVRSTGPLGLAARQRSFEVPGQLRTLHPFPARKHLPSRLAVLRQLDGRAALRVPPLGHRSPPHREPLVRGDDVLDLLGRTLGDRRCGILTGGVLSQGERPEQPRPVVRVVGVSADPSISCLEKA